jgi:hypothetical protein
MMYHLRRWPSTLVYEDAVAFVAHPERNILVGLLTGCSPVRVPEIDLLSDFVEGAESLA